jgi:GTP pyrophosphokinase
MHDYSKDLVTKYTSRRPLLEDLGRNLQHATEEILSDTARIDRISFRVKDVDRFMAKVSGKRAEEAYDEPLREVEDQVAGRVLVLLRADLDVVMNVIAKEFSSVELRRKAPSTTEFGYESDHSIFGSPRLPVVRFSDS